MRGKNSLKKNKSKKTKIFRKRKTLKRYRKQKLIGGEMEQEGFQKSFSSRKRGRDTLEQTETLEQMQKRIRKEKKQLTKEKQLGIASLYENLPKLRGRRGPRFDVLFVDSSGLNASKGYKGHSQVSLEDIGSFVNEKVKDGPNIVNFAVGNYSHAILVDVQEDKVMISDWNGDKVLKSPEVRSSPEYRNYRELIEKLEEKYGRPIEFYPVDSYLNGIAEIKNKEKGDVGGCSEYLYSWIDVYYSKGYYENPFL